MASNEMRQLKQQCWHIFSLSYSLRTTIIHSVLLYFSHTLHHFHFIMHNDYHSDAAPSGDSAITPSEDGQSMNTGYAITPQDAVKLQEYLQEFQGADTNLRIRIVDTAMARLYRERPANANTSFDKEDVRKVCDIHAPTISLPTLCSICSRKSGNGFITIMFALGVNIPSLLANGLLGMPSITLTVMRSWPLQERCLGASRDIQASWELSRMQPHPCGMSFPLRIKRTT